MSSELLTAEVIFSQSVPLPGIRRHALDPDSKPLHSAVHDLESFFWVLVWLCLLLVRPAEARNTEDCGRVLRDAMKDLFDGDEDRYLAASKELTWVSDQKFTNKVLINISPYCLPLKNLVITFRRTLYNAYIERNFEGLHEAVLALFDDALAQLEPLSNEYLPAMIEEDRRRAKDCPGHWDTHALKRSGKAPLPSSLPASPSSSDAPEAKKRRKD